MSRETWRLVILWLGLAITAVILLGSLILFRRKKVAQEGTPQEENQQSMPGEDDETIRVLLKNNDSSYDAYENISVTCDTAFYIEYSGSKKTENFFERQESEMSLAKGGTDEPSEELEEGSKEEQKTERALSPEKERKMYYSAGEEVELCRDDLEEDERICIRPTIASGKIRVSQIHRSQGVPWYRGSLEVVKTAEGLVLINELPLEEYLYGVLPSEMPASYPMEALKAQAICARTYAHACLQKAKQSAYGAHVDDSVSYQVYGNLAENEQTTQAVRETDGLFLFQKEKTADADSNRKVLADTYYYSTSWGLGTDTAIWSLSPQETACFDNGIFEEALRACLTGEEAEAIFEITAQSLKVEEKAAEESGIKEGQTKGSKIEETELGENKIINNGLKALQKIVPEGIIWDLEAEEPWYRWTYTVEKLDPEVLYTRLQERYKVVPDRILALDRVSGEYVSRQIEPFDTVKSIKISQRGAGGVARELLIETSEGTYLVLLEYNIRYCLCDGSSGCVRQDGSMRACSMLLPSGFFVVDTVQEGESVIGYTLSGGGYGHGVGMSQNGARQLALRGFSAEEILQYYYKDTVCTSR